MMESSNLGTADRPTPGVSFDPYYKLKQMVPADSPDSPRQGPLRAVWSRQRELEEVSGELAFKTS